MKHGRKRLLSILLSLALVLGLMPGLSLTAYAGDTSTVVWSSSAGSFPQDVVTIQEGNARPTHPYNEYWNLGTSQGGTFLTSQGVFQKIEISGGQRYHSFPGDGNGWNGGTWTGSSASVRFNGFVYDNYGSKPFTITFTIGPAHLHNFTYAASGATITASCGAAGCDLPESSAGAGDHVATLTIAANGGTYDGTNAYGATITDANSIQGDAKVQYQKKTDGSYGTATETAPTDAGDYKASITVGGATASVEYTIAQADPTANAPTGLTATYGQTLANVSLEGKNPQGNTPGTWAWADSTESVGNVVTPAATFKATFTPDSSNYKTVENVEVSVTVSKAEADIRAKNQSINVGGTVPDLSNPVQDTHYTVTGLVGSDTFTAELSMYYLKDGAQVTPDASKTGEYNIVCIGPKSTDNYLFAYFGGKLTIAEKPAATVTTAPQANTLTYNGQAQALVTAGVADGGTMQYALGTETEATQPYTTSIPTGTEPGTYYVWYKAVGDENHNDSAASYITATIRGAISQTVAFKVVNGSWDDETTADKTVTLTGFEGDALKLAATDIPAVGNKPNDTFKAGAWDVTPGADTEITAATTYTYTYAEKATVSHTVTLKVVHGAWTDGTRADKTIVLTGKEGDELRLQFEQIPEVTKPDEGYSAQTGLWDKEPPFVLDGQTYGDPITEDAVYTYTYGTAEAPTEAPTQAPTEAPTEAPTQAPTEAPTEAPTQAPTEAPTEAPTQAPTEAPTVKPTAKPTTEPTSKPAKPDYVLFAKLKASGSRTLELTWTKAEGAKGYDVYFAKCGEKLTKIASVSAKEGRGYRFSKLEKHTGYKAYVRAWKKTNGKKKYIGEASPVVHALTGNSNEKYTNAASVKADADKMKLTVGEQGSIAAGVEGVKANRKVYAHDGRLRWYSSDRNVAKVNDQGVVTAVGKGSCSVYALASNGVRARVKIKVVTAPAKLAFEESSYSVKKGKTLKLAKKLKVTPKDTKTTYTWKSSDSSVAKVNKKGVVTALKKGTVTITVKAKNGKKAKVKVTVK